MVKKELSLHHNIKHGINSYTIKINDWKNDRTLHPFERFQKLKSGYTCYSMFGNRLIGTNIITTNTELKIIIDLSKVPETFFNQILNEELRDILFDPLDDIPVKGMNNMGSYYPL